MVTEKRSHPRVAAEFPARLGSIDSAVVRDISLSGVRCTTPAPVAPMTIVAVRLELPQGPENDRSWTEIACRGVVVRSRPLPGEGDAKYEAAIFFQDLPEDHRAKLARFVDDRLRASAV